MHKHSFYKHLRPASLPQTHLSFHCSDSVVKYLRQPEESDSTSIFLLFVLTSVVLEQLMITSSTPKPACFGKHHLGCFLCRLHTYKVNISLLFWGSNKAFGSQTLKLPIYWESWKGEIQRLLCHILDDLLTPKVPMIMWCCLLPVSSHSLYIQLAKIIASSQTE